MSASIPAPSFLTTRLRYLRLAGHVLSGALTVLLLFPFLDRGERERRLVRWAGGLLGAVGVRVVMRGRPPTVRGGGALIVANHVSWLDIHVLHSLLPARFVSKAEVRDWPLIGWLADKAGGTLFLERTRRSDARRMNGVMARHLHEGDCLALFPEGTTSDGSGVLPFYASLFQPATEAEATVWPARIRYLRQDGSSCTAAAYYGDLSLLASLGRIVREPGIVAEIEFLPAIPARGRGRKELAAEAEAAIRAALAPAGRDSAPGTVVHPLAGSR